MTGTLHLLSQKIKWNISMARLIKKVRNKGNYDSVEIRRSKYPARICLNGDKNVYLVDSIDLVFWQNTNPKGGGYGTNISQLTVQDLIALKRAVNTSLKMLRSHEDNK